MAGFLSETTSGTACAHRIAPSWWWPAPSSPSTRWPKPSSATQQTRPRCSRTVCGGQPNWCSSPFVSCSPPPPGGKAPTTRRCNTIRLIIRGLPPSWSGRHSTGEAARPPNMRRCYSSADLHPFTGITSTTTFLGCNPSASLDWLIASAIGGPGSPPPPDARAPPARLRSLFGRLPVKGQQTENRTSQTNHQVVPPAVLEDEKPFGAVHRPDG